MPQLVEHRRVASSSLTAGGVTVLCSWARNFIRCLVLVQPRKTRPGLILARNDDGPLKWANGPYPIQIHANFQILMGHLKFLWALCKIWWAQESLISTLEHNWHEIWITCIWGPAENKVYFKKKITVFSQMDPAHPRMNPARPNMTEKLLTQGPNKLYTAMFSVCTKNSTRVAPNQYCIYAEWINKPKKLMYETGSPSYVHKFISMLKQIKRDNPNIVLPSELSFLSALKLSHQYIDYLLVWVTNKFDDGSQSTNVYEAFVCCSIHLSTLFPWQAWTSTSPVLCAHNWQQPFLNDSAEGWRMTVEIISWSTSMKVWDWAGIKLATPGSAVRLPSVARHVQWFIYNFGLMGPGTHCFPNQWVQLRVQNTISHDKSEIPLHPGTPWNKNFASQRQNYVQKMQNAQVKNHCMLVTDCAARPGV